MTGKRLIVNSHYSKWIIRPQDCPLRDSSDYCGIICDILCGYNKFAPDCPLDNWEGGE